MLDCPQDQSASLYVHVPFCAKKCSYCAFYSEASQGELVERYVRALITELALLAGKTRPKTIFFGGGTPSLLNLRQWEKILLAMQRFGLASAGEWTVECNPATVSLDKARLLRSFGVNRISMGVQSLDETMLERLGRVHSRDMVFKSFDTLRRAGFTNVNLDLMFAIPGQSMDVWASTVSEVLALESEHLSCYEVIYEEDTPLFAQLEAGEFTDDEDLACDMYDLLLQKTARAGFTRYEVANFARGAMLEHGPDDLFIPERACRHNVNYWRGGDFHGLGPSATSYLQGVRRKNFSNTTRYCELLEAGRQPVESQEELESFRRAGETAAFGLRMEAGWGFNEFYSQTGYDLRAGWQEEMRDLTERGWGRSSGRRFQLTSEGLRFADAAAELFLR